jgi:hypothetical protein
VRQHLDLSHKVSYKAQESDQWFFLRHRARSFLLLSNPPFCSWGWSALTTVLSRAAPPCVHIHTVYLQFRCPHSSHRSHSAHTQKKQGKMFYLFISTSSPGHLKVKAFGSKNQLWVKKALLLPSPWRHLREWPLVSHRLESVGHDQHETCISHCRSLSEGNYFLLCHG